jgi:hypothetical protein
MEDSFWAMWACCRFFVLHWQTLVLISVGCGLVAGIGDIRHRRLIERAARVVIQEREAPITAVRQSANLNGGAHALVSGSVPSVVRRTNPWQTMASQTRANVEAPEMPTKTPVG